MPKTIKPTIKPTMNIRDWEKGFELKFGRNSGRLTFYNEQKYYWNNEFYKEILDFIKDLLSQSRQEIVKEIDLMWDKKETDKNRYSVGWNSALAELEARLKLTQPRQSNNLNK